MKKAEQRSAMPTRKLMTGLPIMGAVSEVWGRVMADVFPPLAGSDTSMLAGMLVAAFVSYFVPDAPNEPTT